jgi:hypothetical protein
VVRIYARENAIQRDNIPTALAGSVAADLVPPPSRTA